MLTEQELHTSMLQGLTLLRRMVSPLMVMQEMADKGDVLIMVEIKAFVTDRRFLTGLVLGFTLGALHHYFGL